MRFLAHILLVFLLITGLADAAHAAEEIRDFHVVIDVGADGTLTVTETITVNAEQRQISRGIFRDIPIRFKDENGRTREMRLDVQRVTRDGQDEPFTLERAAGVLRIRIGDANVLLPPDTYTYAITYETPRQIRYFDSHDELYWNVTGTGWDFPILQASAEIRLPSGAQAGDITYFTGRQGSTEQAAQAERLDGGNRVVIEATRPLSRREGLTAVVAIPKGVIAPPSAADLRTDWWHDNLGWLIGAIGLALVLAFYSWAWRRVGRDPPKEIVVPRWAAPADTSPGLANYIEARGFRGAGWDAFSASVIGLAVKGHLRLEQPGETITIHRISDGIPAGIGVGQRAILKELPASGDTLVIDRENGKTVEKIGQAFRQAIETEHRNQFYRANAIYLTGGVFISALTVFLLIRHGGFGRDMTIALGGIAIPAAIFAMAAVSAGRELRIARSLGSRIATVLILAVVGFIISGVGAEFASMVTWASYDSRVLTVIAGLVITNIVFFLIMGAPTPIGQTRSAEIAGLRQYLTLAEKDRMNMQGAPEMSPQHFETLLPYAVALGVEKPWSQAFDIWLATALATGTVSYTGPRWYRGSDVGPGRIGTGLGNMAGSLSTSFTASLPVASRSSSGFSGGSSGGGGGGGGGGGW